MPVRGQPLWLYKTTVLFIDEASMIDNDAWFAIKDQMTTVAETPLQQPGRRPHPSKDEFGRMHLIVCCDYKQLPPATSKPPFIAADTAVMDLEMGEDDYDDFKNQSTRESVERLFFKKFSRRCCTALVEVAWG